MYFVVMNKRVPNCTQQQLQLETIISTEIIKFIK